MSRRALVRHEGQEDEIDPSSDEEMVKRRRVAAMIRERMAMPVTEEGQQLWQELKDELDRARQSRS